MICFPTRITGFSAVMGSWKTIPICEPHTLRISLAPRLPISRSSNRMDPSRITFFFGSRPIIERESTVLPEPERRLREYPHQLSGGMRQRVMIAIALACGPKLLFADEPTTALDVTVQAQILDLLGAQQRERFMAMILVTHDLGVVAGRADEIAVMYAGKVVEKGPARVLFTDMKMPYTEALLQSIPKIDDKSHTRLRVIGGRPPALINPPAGCRFAPRCPYAQPKCVEEEPPLLPASTPGHEFRCWFPVGTPEGKAALERNAAAGTTAAVEAAVAGDGATAAAAVPSGGSD